MRNSKARCLNHCHQEEKHDDDGNGFVIREIPIHKLFNGGQGGANNGSDSDDDLSQFSKGKSFSSSGMNNALMDYDMPEFVVFIQEDPNQFVKDLCIIDRLVSPQDKNLSEEDCELNHNVVCLIHPNLVTMETIPSTLYSEGTEFVFQHHSIMDGMRKCDCRNLMMRGEGMVDLGDKVSIDNNTTRTSRKLREGFKKDAEFSRSFKNRQMNPYLGTSGGSRVEFPNSPIMYAPFVTSMSKPEMGNSESIIGSSEDISSFSFEEPSSSPSHHHQSNDSTSRTHSFAFPILSPKWNGSPVRMLEADKSQLEKPMWHKMLFSWWKCC